MSSDNAQDKSPPGSGPSPNPGSEPHQKDPRRHYDHLHAKYHQLEAKSAMRLVFVGLWASIIGTGTLMAIFLQTCATQKSATAAATAASVAANSLAQTKVQATEESTEFTKQLIALNRQAKAESTAAAAAQSAADTAVGSLKETKIVASQTFGEAEKSRAQAQTNFIAEQRPYVTVTTQMGIVTNGAQDRFGNYWFVCALLLSNSGKSPAQNVRIAWGVWNSPTGRSSNEAWSFFGVPDKRWRWTRMPPLPPGASLQGTPYGSVAHWGPYANNKFAALVNVFDGLSIFGRVRYDDPRRNHFYTDFCLYRPGSNGAGFCEHHNYLN